MEKRGPHDREEACTNTMHKDAELDGEDICSNMLANVKLDGEGKVVNIIKSENDDREYEFLILKNGMKILLISDSTTEKAAVSLHVHVGFASDPDGIPGLAHFCEHMLFLGTEKYPEEDEYGKFISQNGGCTNAFTMGEFTNYHFDVKSEALLPAIDRFAQFFISPLFDASSTDRELHAINSEFKNYILKDSWRENYINAFTAKAGHAYQKFGVGNLETLKTIPEEKNIDIRSVLLDFHSKYYSANIMTVAVLGKEPVEELAKMCVPLFEKVTNKNVVVPSYNEYPYGRDELGVILRIPPIMEIKSLDLKFMIPDVQKYYKVKPWEYLTHLLGHEGKGSLLSLLKRKLWVNTLYAGCENGLKGFDFFTITMSLTDEGLDAIFEIIDVCFQYINMLKREGPQRWIYNEIKTLNDVYFRFRSKQEPQSYVTSLSSCMHYYPPEDVLYGGYRIDTFAADMIMEVLAYLNPSNFRCTVQSQTFEGKTDKVVRYYDAAYSIERIPLQQIERWSNIGCHDELHLPSENIFIPDSLDIVVCRETKEDKDVPRVIKDNKIMRVWYKPDDTFFLPKAFLMIHVMSPLAYMTPSHVNHLSMFRRLLSDELVEFAYDAELAGIAYNIDSDDYGFSIEISGFNSKQAILLKKILEHVNDFNVKDDRFKVNKVELLEDLNNTELFEPYRQVPCLKYYALSEKEWSNKERLQYMDDLTAESLKRFIEEYLKSVYLECLFCGNLSRDDTEEVCSTVASHLTEGDHVKPLLPAQHILTREYKISKNVNYLFEKRSKIHSSTCVYVYFQIGLQETRRNVLCELFCQLIEAPYFDILRTKEQLGYIVMSGTVGSDSVNGIKALIQTEKSPSEVFEKIENFFETFEETMSCMSDAELQEYIEALATKILKKPKNLYNESHKFWGEISCKQYHFRRSKLEVDELRKLTKADVVQFIRKFILSTSLDCRRITFAVLGKDAESLAEAENKSWQVIDDVLKFKMTLPLYPNVLPYDDVPLLALTE